MINATYLDAGPTGSVALSGKGIAFTRTPGLSPNANAASLARTGAPSLSHGTITLTDGSNSVSFADQYAEEFYDTDETEWRAVFLDKRWQLRYNRITGEYNRPAKDGALNQEQHVQALAALLLTAMGEAGYDVSALPTNIYPHVCWEAANPADELNRLLREYDFVPVLRNGGTFRVWSQGVGADLPPAPYRRRSSGQKRTRKPDQVVIRGGRSIIQRTFTLTPYGRDTDGAWKGLADLSYAPDAGDVDGGFGADARHFFMTGTYTDEERALARETVFTTYGLTPALRYCRPWLDRIVDTTTEDGVTRPKEPFVAIPADGRHIWDQKRDQFVEDEAGILDEGYQIDADNGLIIFSEPMFRVDEPEKATKFLSITNMQATVAFESLADDGTWGDDDHYEKTDGSGDLVAVYKNERLVLRGIWDADAGEVVWGNQTELDTFADAWIAQITQAEEFILSEEIEYPRIVDVDCDGRIRSVTWNVSESGATTVLSMNTERALGRAPTFKERTAASGTRSSVAAGDSDRSKASYRDSTDAARKPRPAPGKIPVSEAAMNQGERRRVVNRTGAEIPAHAAVEFDGIDGTEACLKIKKPTAAGVAYWAITDNEIAADALGEVFISGHHFALVDAAVAAGDRVATQETSHELAASDSGSGYVLATTTIGAATEALIAMGSSAAASGPKACKITADHTNGTYDVEEWDRDSDTGTGWTQEGIKLWEVAAGVDFWGGAGAGNYVLVIEQSGTYWISVGWANLES